MSALITGSLILSILHALIPSHWLPVLAIGRQEQWTIARITQVTFLSGLAHALSTVAIGVGIALVGTQLTNKVEYFAAYVTPAMLMALGVFFIYRHHRHQHFHAHGEKVTSGHGVIVSLVGMMFLSPCLEIEAYFLLASGYGWGAVVFLALLYTVVTVTGMMIWIQITYRGLLKFNWHAIEHNAGIITGITLVCTGLISFMIK